MTQWKDNIKPKVVTKIGQVIEPIKSSEEYKNG
jgi:U3 small nucleolar RNA-associated protein 14